MPGTPWPKKKPPGNVTGLQRWVGEWAQSTGTTADALQRGISTMVLAGMLGRVVDASGSPVALVKGGRHMLLRYGSSARPSKDFDLAVADDAAHVDRILREAVRDPYLGFTATLSGPAEPIRDTGSLRVIVKLTYEGRPWQSVKVEAARNEAPKGEVDLLAPNPDLSLFGLTESTAPIPCLPARYQIAQKLHAVTEVWESTSDEARENDRFRDLLDLQLLATEVDRIGIAAVHSACLDVFEGRGKHSWPPAVHVYPFWGPEYARIASRINFPVTDMGEAAAAVTALIRRIDQG